MAGLVVYAGIEWLGWWSMLVYSGWASGLTNRLSVQLQTCTHQSDAVMFSTLLACKLPARVMVECK